MGGMGGIGVSVVFLPYNSSFLQLWLQGSSGNAVSVVSMVTVVTW